MQFTTFALAALSVSGALAKSATASAADAGATGTTPSGMVKMHVVRVGGANGSLTFSPNEMTAAVGDMVQFQFSPMNHSVVQSTFAAPCMPSGSIFSGFMPVKADAVNTPTYTILINDTTPLWLYCSQAKHCQNGMVMAINAATTGNKTFAAYKALAAKATANVSPSSTGGGTDGTTSSSGSGSGSSSSGSGSSGSGSGSGTSSGASSTSTGATPPQATNAAAVVSASVTFGFVAMVAAFFL